MSCIVGHLLLLKHLFNVAGQHNTIMVPKSWLFLQLSHIIIRELYLIFRDVEVLNSFCQTILKDIKDKFTEIFPIVYDEAQSHTTYLPETFPSVQLNKDRARPFFSIVVRVSTFNQFGRIDTSDELLELATRIFPLEEKRFAEFNLFQFLQLVS
ncbi:unnamed protein product [Rhizophagus irregularis]|nr:unnamed protein product [Rhizophagus irregularis]